MMKSFSNGFFGGLGRSIGKIIALLVFGYFIFNFLSTKKDDIKNTIRTDIEEMIPFE